MASSDRSSPVTHSDTCAPYRIASLVRPMACRSVASAGRQGGDPDAGKNAPARRISVPTTCGVPSPRNGPRPESSRPGWPCERPADSAVEFRRRRRRPCFLPTIAEESTEDSRIPTATSVRFRQAQLLNHCFLGRRGAHGAGTHGEVVGGGQPPPGILRREASRHGIVGLDADPDPAPIRADRRRRGPRRPARPSTSWRRADPPPANRSTSTPQSMIGTWNPSSYTAIRRRSDCEISNSLSA